MKGHTIKFKGYECFCCSDGLFPSKKDFVHHFLEAHSRKRNVHMCTKCTTPHRTKKGAEACCRR